jgi:hypothetical protein
MNLYNGFCYADMTALTNAIVSEPIQTTGSTLTYSALVSYTGNTATFSTAVGNYTRTFVECSNVGPTTTTTMMSALDAVELSAAVTLVWALAWGVKVVRRAL